MTEITDPYKEKLENDKNNLKAIELRSGTANQQLINAAYLGARKEPTKTMDWLNAANQGFVSFKVAIENGKRAEEKRINEINDKIDTQVDDIITNGYSLGQTYYSEASNYTKNLREQYVAADGDPAKQQELKLELNLASQSIKTVKDQIQSITDSWGLEGDESMLEKSGLSDEQLNIMEVCLNEKNAIWDKDEKTFKWKNPNYQKNDENGLPLPGADKEFYEIKDMQNIEKFASKDFEGKQQYIADEKAIIKSGDEFKEKGTGDAFNYRLTMKANEKRITKENIHFYMNGDFNNDETFVNSILEHPEWLESFKIFDHLKTISNTDGTLAYDQTGEGEITWDDFTDPTPETGITEDDKVKMMHEVYKAITDKNAVGYDFDLSKKLISEYMTARQKTAFYGGNTDDLDTYNPEAMGVESWEEYIAAGGNRGYAEQVLCWRRHDAKLYPAGHKYAGKIKEKAVWYKDENCGFTAVLNQ